MRNLLTLFISLLSLMLLSCADSDTKSIEVSGGNLAEQSSTQIATVYCSTTWAKGEVPWATKDMVFSGMVVNDFGQYKLIYAPFSTRVVGTRYELTDLQGNEVWLYLGALSGVASPTQMQNLLQQASCTGSGGITTDAADSEIVFNRNGSLTGSDSLKWTGISSQMDVIGKLNMGYGQSNSNVSIGFNALGTSGLSSSMRNVAIGPYALGSIAGGDNNVAVGYYAGYAQQYGGKNIMIGNFAGQYGTNTSNNVWIGDGSGEGTGGNSVAIGVDAMGTQSTNSSYVAIGYMASKDGNCSSCVTIGSSAARYNDANDFVAIGASAGERDKAAAVVASNAEGVYIGKSCRSHANGSTNEIVIGYACDGNGSNTATIGNSSQVDCYITGNVRSSGSYVGKVTIDNTATYSTVKGDYIVIDTYSSTGISTITLDTDNLISGYVIIVKDGGSAASNNITIDTEGAALIDGAASITITANYGSVTLVSDGTNWFVID